MTTPEDEFDNDIGEAVLPVEVDETAVPIALDTLQPWHRPRKQFIRERQWRACAELLIQKLKNQNAPSIRPGKLNYLTLPGIDHFDVEILGTLAVDSGLKLEATGFLSEAERDPIKARSQFRADTLIKRGLMEDTSITFPYRFEDMSNRQSQAYLEIKSRAPFHIINIDACGSIAAPTALHSARIIDALHRLVELQLGTMRDPWLLYLTTDAREGSLSTTVKTALDDAIRQNAAASNEFRDGAINCFGLAGDDLEAALTGTLTKPARFVSKFSLGFAKWLLHNANDQSWDVKCRPFFCYSTRPHGENEVSMPCLAFEFRPRPVLLGDRFGAVNPKNPDLPEPPNYSLEALNKTRDMQNLDTTLAEDDALRIEFAQKQRDLLQGAGYHAAALDAFDAEHLT